MGRKENGEREGDWEDGEDVEDWGDMEDGEGAGDMEDGGDMEDMKDGEDVGDGGSEAAKHAKGKTAEEQKGGRSEIAERAVD
jgi:hypothetical protein